MNCNESSVSANKRHYYSSSQGPFHNASSIYMFYGGGERGAIVEALIKTVNSDNQLVTVQGERGSGKTMLSLVLADRLKHRYNTIRYDHAQLSPALLLRHLLIEICPQDADMISSQQAANGADARSIKLALQRLATALELPPPGNKAYVLTVDSQTDSDPVTLQLLQDIAAIQVAGRPVVHVVLFRRVDAQTARANAGQQDIQQAAQQYWLRRLTLSEVHGYLQHHMLVYDFNQRDMFTRDMAYFIADQSAGVFRAINTLARSAFMIANLEDADQLSMSHLLMAGLPERVEEPAQPHYIARHRGQLIALLGSCVVVSLAVVVVLLLQ